MRSGIETLGRTITRFVEIVGELTFFALKILRCIATPPIRARAFVEELYKIGKGGTPQAARASRHRPCAG